MARVAVVSGGTRGIGAAIGKALAKAGYRSPPITMAMTRRRPVQQRVRRSDLYSGTFPITKPARPGSPRSKAISGPSKSSSTMPASPGCDASSNAARAMVCGDRHQSQFAVQHVPAGIEGMRERNFGRIVNISSINGQKGQMGQTNDAASKAGDIGFTKSFAQENAKKASP